MRLQKRLLRIMRRHNMRVADLARELETPYTTVREWVVFGREQMQVASSTHEDERRWMEQKLRSLERQTC